MRNTATTMRSTEARRVDRIRRDIRRATMRRATRAKRDTARRDIITMMNQVISFNGIFSIQKLDNLILFYFGKQVTKAKKSTMNTMATSPKKERREERIITRNGDTKKHLHPIRPVNSI